ncbi:hypothetical protein HUN23_12950 [Acinetobacter oleivorans]|uniref:hypothetical protein n=1 Tax=Acinetobacter oleivorans TaxID=1148157 RepID=UPI0015806200|nr:hypothetical protein [Acinetobacter oleivorans]NUF23678.1 hypothetical protein [Acinetobacter oleivorans]
MSKKTKLYIAIYILAVFIYTAIFCIINFKHLTLLDSPSLGDFLSGLFAPIAFLYLLLGYKQQEKALNQTNKDILEQLRIQKKLLELQLKDQKAKEHAAQPIIDFWVTAKDIPYNKEFINLRTSRPQESFKRRFNINLNNSGEKVSQVNVTCEMPLYKRIAFNRVLSESEPLRIYFDLGESEIIEHMVEKGIDLKIQITYRTSIGLRYKLKYEVTTVESVKSTHPTVIYSPISNPIQID